MVLDFQYHGTLGARTKSWTTTVVVQIIPTPTEMLGAADAIGTVQDLICTHPFSATMEWWREIQMDIVVTSQRSTFMRLAFSMTPKLD